MADGATIVGPHQSFATECMLLDAKVRRLQQENAELRHDIGRYVAIASGQAEEVERLRAALLRVAFDEDLSDLAGDPGRWFFTTAYIALGGQVVQGKLPDLDRLQAEYATLAEEPRGGAG